jgi:hypothetical protein
MKVVFNSNLLMKWVEDKRNEVVLSGLGRNQTEALAAKNAYR